jgi:hypothetical protein
VGHDGSLVTSVPRPKGKGATAKRDANVRLITASPDLYKQLCNLEAWIRDAAASGGEGINWYAVNEIDGAEARAAIAKVKGGDA